METEVFSGKELRKDILKLAWPCVVEQTFACLIATISTTLVSSIGKEAVNAVSICNQPMYIPNVIFQAFNVGGTALIARFLGMKDRDNARKTCAQTLILSLMMGLVASLFLRFFGGAVIRFLGATDDYYYLALEYMNYASIGLIFQALSTSIAAMLRGAGRTRLSMYFNIVASATNVIVGYTMISVFGLGVRGAGIAFLIAHITGCSIALAQLFFRKKMEIHITPKEVFHFDIRLIGRIANVGIGTALEQVALRIGMIFFTTQIVGLGTEQYAAHNISGNIDNYTCIMATALSVSLTPLVGQSLGALELKKAERYFGEAIKIGLICSAVLVTILVAFPRYLALIFIRDESVIYYVERCLRMLAITTPGQILQMSVCGGLRGGGDTRWPLISTMIGILGVRTSLVILLIKVMGMDVSGAWLAMAIDQTMRAVIIFFRYKSGKWKTIRV
ncbi:MAG: MATE family efflux transporter [Clostridia bacterium]|nr:MATE family efflux transporter [Clostridia bacterium]MBQ4458286.1 MATE family efflux transporter [Clostridia bacterium]MBQ5956080.1 MATE family efflux transporter [Clostridia bacterium]MBR3564333.1 MATE family efflux transporter [Clostridia bacterium]MBR6822797.1 MATE family efflux transporter [Clostridia bacterium]